MKRDNRRVSALTYATMALLAASFLLPFAWVVRSSLMEPSQIFVMPPEWIPKPVLFDNYKEAMTILPFGLYFGNTLIITVSVIVGTVLTSTMAAFGFTRVSWKGRDLLFGIILTSMMLPGFVTLVPSFIGWRSLGLYDTYAPLIVPAFFGGGAFNIFLLRQFFKAIPMDLDEAAYMDGAGFVRIYWNIILPLSRSPMIVVALFTFMGCWNDFFTPLIYLESDSKFTVSLGLQQFLGMYSAQWNLLMAASTVVIAPAILVFLLGQKYFVKGITMTGLKG